MKTDALPLHKREAGYNNDAVKVSTQHGSMFCTFEHAFADCLGCITLIDQ